MEIGARAPATLLPVDFDSVATLRFTSGTTGAPKAATFDHAKLRWIAETLAALLPWRARIQPARYLSFLPMNHVVEGILATYGAYYISAPLDVYFLEDFRKLPAAMRAARPTVFFAVPRVYEKIWEGVLASVLGRRYLAAPPSLTRDLLRAVVRRLVLRRTGLEACAQLIAGSAPVAGSLQRAFRDLGTDIYGAYGLTEAPLVTINRVGSNHIGTVGRPLPRTEIAIADDGEILVRGPQVMCGYDAVIDQPFRTGWLLTGDLGHITSDGDLIIDGRKKEMIATAYGKKVNPDRVEGLLRQIPGVREAILIGEGRPYCSALYTQTTAREAVPR